MRLLALIVFLTTTVSARPAHFITSGSPSGNRIALTFDAGADRGYGPEILSLLERSKIKVSFGMTGRWAQANPDLVRRMARDGDTFLNHTYDHRSFTGVSDRLGGLTVAQRASEIKRADAVIHRLTGLSSKPYFRFPYGDYDAAAVQLVARLGYPNIVMWTVDSLGWERISTSAIVARCSSLVLPGAIVLMHVGIQSNDYHALSTLIGIWHRKHYRFVTVPQLLKGAQTVSSFASRRSDSMHSVARSASISAS